MADKVGGEKVGNVRVYEQQEKKRPIWLWLLPLLLLLGLGAWWLFGRNEDRPETTATAERTEAPVHAAPLARTASSIADEIRQAGRVGFTDEEVHFDTAQAKIVGEDQAVLNEVVKALQQNPDWRMRVLGHTDSTGDAAANQKLSQARAEAVRNYLTGHGIDAGRLQLAGLGEAQPEAPNSTESGRAENRRVELIKI